MATATDIYQEVLFSDGEAADFSDINDLQRRFRALVSEALLGGRIGNAPQIPGGGIPSVDPEMGDWPLAFGELMAGDVAFAPYPGNGMITIYGAGANQISINPGVMVQQLEDVATHADADEPSCAVFVNNDIVTLATAVGDATNPRIDIIEMKLETVSDTPIARDFEDAVTRVKSSASPNKARRTKATFQIKQGTPAATPAYPDVTTSFVALGAVYVPATHNAVHSISNLRDLRFPLGGITVHDIEYNQLNINGGGTPWTLDHAGMRADSDDPSGFVYALCPGGSCGRVIAVGVFGEFPAGGGILLRRLTHDGTTPIPKTTLCDLQTPIHDALSSGPQFAWANVLHFMDEVVASHGTRVANKRIGAPIWNNGTHSGPSAQVGVEDDTTATRTRLALEIIGDNPDTGTFIGFVRWVVAHGMG